MKHLIPLLEELVSRASVTPDDAGCQDIIHTRLTKAGFKCETMKFHEVTNLWAKYGNGNPLIVFAGHTDVVPTGPESDWESPPFKPTQRDGHIFGRGTADMKGALTAMIIAAEQFVAEHPNFPGSIGFLITSDEEGPGLNGTKKVIEALVARGEKINYCVIGEPSSMKSAGDQVRIGRRGSLHGTLTIHGKQGHVAHPQFAINPIHESAQALHELSHLEWDKGNDDFPPTTFQITNIHGGTGATNVIPGHLEVLFNFRYSTASTVESLQKKTEAILNKYHLKYDLNWKSGAEPFLSKSKTLVTGITEAINKVTGQHPIFSTGGGTSDGRFLVPLGIEVIELGASGATAHHVNENISVENLENLAKIYHEFLLRMFEVSPQPSSRGLTAGSSR